MPAGAGPSALAPSRDLAVARATLEEYASEDPHQLQIRDRMLAFIERHPEEAHERTCLEGHLTASVLLVDAPRARVLLHHHRKLDRWLQFGGHCDGDANLLGCAHRELEEESGIAPAWLGPGPADLDIHSIPAHGTEPEHLHLDVRFLAGAPADARERVSAESHELRWFTPSEARALELDDSVSRLIRLALQR